MARKRFAARAAAAAVGVVAISALALPAFALTGDIDGVKYEDTTGPSANGDDIEYDVVLTNNSDNYQDDLVVYDVMDPGLVYVDESTVVAVFNYVATSGDYPGVPGDLTFGAESNADNFLAKDHLPELDGGADTDGTRYASPGEGAWIGAWYEQNDPVALEDPPLDPETNGIVQSYGRTGGDDNSISFAGDFADPGTGTLGPAIVRQFNAANWFELELIFQTNEDELDGDETLGVWVSGNGSTWTFVDEFGPGGADEVRSVDISALNYVPTAYIRIGPTSALDDGDLWVMDNVIIAGIQENIAVYDNVAGGSNTDLLDGTPASIVSEGDGIDLYPVATRGFGSYPSFAYVTYNATVDTSATIEYALWLDNEVSWSSGAYDLDEFDDPEFDSTTQSIEVLYEPEIDVTITSNSPVNTGQPIIITVVFEHGDDSDGSPVCVDDSDTDVTYAVGATVVNKVKSLGDQDECLEVGEKWTFTLTYPGRPTAGTVPFNGALSGYSVNAGQEDDFDVNVTASTDVVVVLADTGAANTGLAGIAAALVALGTAALVVARRRNA